jgi:predicted amino acid racemase
VTAPRLEIDLDRIEHNARTLTNRLAARGISVTGVTKAALGCADIANALMRAGVSRLGDSRIENIEAMRREQIAAPIMMIRSPMPSQVDRVVQATEMSCNTELAVITRLSYAARRAGRSHAVMLMVELGDLREGIMPDDLEDTVRAVLQLPNITLIGIGANLACHGGVVPDVNNMAELSALAESIEGTFDMHLELVSGGNSANLNWALSGEETGRINNLRLGEAILLGCEPLHRQPIDGLYTDAITLVAEVIESKTKPAQPWGNLAETAFGQTPVVAGPACASRTILALGHQDVDPSGILPPSGIRILGASGDHLITCSDSDDPVVGDEIRFGLNYSALVRAMTSPLVLKTKSVEESQSRTPR